MSLKSPYKQGGMFEGASHFIFENAKQLRKNMTPAEIALWLHLKKGIDGLKFRRQHPIGLYVADFYCHSAKLIVEVDGSIHNNPDILELDIRRQKELEGLGYSLIRFTNEQVLQQPEDVIAAITLAISHLNILPKQNTLQTAESKSPL